MLEAFAEKSMASDPKLTMKTSSRNRRVSKAVKDLVQPRKTVTAAAGSKVLISGAYLIINPSNEGIVLSTDAKFYTTVKELPADLSNPTQSVIRVKSPQFKLDLEYKIT